LQNGASDTAKKTFGEQNLFELFKSKVFARESLDYRTFSKIYTSELDRLFNELKKAAKNYILEVEKYRLSGFSKLLKLYKASNLELNKEINALSFADINKLVFKLLVQSLDKEALYFRLDGRINHLLVDEFQDTNVIQYEIILPLIAEIVSGYGQNGLGSFFYVGDTKQSIYKFRGGKKELFDKTEGRQYYWIVQSFDNEHGEQSYNAEDIHEMGKELAEVFAKKGYQVVVETHNDTDNLHNHLIINSVNSETGKKLRISNAKSLEVSKGADILTKDLYRLNDEICKKYGLRTLDQSKAIKNERERHAGMQPTSKKTDENYLAKSWKDTLRQDLQDIWKDKNIKSKDDFERALQQKGITISRMTSTGNITYEQGGNKARAKSLGAFNRDDVSSLLERNKSLGQTISRGFSR